MGGQGFDGLISDQISPFNISSYNQPSDKFSGLI